MVHELYLNLKITGDGLIQFLIAYRFLNYSLGGEDLGSIKGGHRFSAAGAVLV
jgi:hypothetical protein